MQKQTKNRLGKVFLEVFGGGIFFPILRSDVCNAERKIIRKANLALSIFWGLFLLAMAIVLLTY